MPVSLAGASIEVRGVKLLTKYFCKFKGIPMSEDVKNLAAIASAAASTIGAGSIVVAEITAPAFGVLGILGFTTTTTVALPVAGIVAVGGLVCYGAYKAYEHLERQKA